MPDQNPPSSDNLQALFGEGWLLPLESRALEPQTLELAKPVTHGGQTLERVTLGVVKGIHARQAPATWETHDALLRMAGLLSGLPDSVLDQLEGGDLVAVIDATLRLLWPLLELPATGAALEGAAHRPWPSLSAPFTLQLSKKIKAEGEARSSLTFHPITGKLVRKFPNNLETRQLPALVEGLTGITSELFDQLEGLDLSRALGVAQCFFAGTRPTTRAPGPGSPPSSTGAPRS